MNPKLLLFTSLLGVEGRLPEYDTRAETPCIKGRGEDGRDGDG